MTAFRFIHTADIHLDSPLLGLARHQGTAAERIRSATRLAFEALITEAIEEKVDFVVIAGDLYDGDWRDFHTGLFFVSQMGRLARAGIRAFVLHGNHDAESQLTRRLRLPDVVSVFPFRKAGTFTLDDIQVALHGQSFPERAVTGNLAARYPDPRPGYFNIGVLHTALGGMGPHENYAPCTLDELVAKGYQYWALGHVHEGQLLHRHPHVVFPGNLQGRHIRETGPKGAQLVSVQEGEIVDLSTIHCDVVRWARLAVDAGECRRTAQVFDRVRDAIERAVASQADGRLLACRIEITGRTPLHGALLGATDSLLAEAQSAALGLGEDSAWIERIVISTAEEGRSIAPEAQALPDELARLLEGAGRDEELSRQLAEELGEFLRKLPPDLRMAPEDPVLGSAIDGDIGRLVDATRDELFTRLRESGETS